MPDLLSIVLDALSAFEETIKAGDREWPSYPAPADDPDETLRTYLGDIRDASYIISALMPGPRLTPAERRAALGLLDKMKGIVDTAADNTDSVKSSTVKTWSYSRLNRGGADVTLDLTFEGTDDEWAEHLAELTNQGIEPYNAKITGPVTALGTDFPATPEGFRAAQAEADRMANEENARIAAANRAATDRAPTAVDVIAAAQRRGEAGRLQPRAPHLELAEFLVAHPALAAEFINSALTTTKKE